MELAECHLHWRPSKYKGKVTRSYSLAKAVWVNGKNRKIIVAPLGQLTEEEVEKWRLDLKHAKDSKKGANLGSLNDVEVESNLSYLDVAVVLETWNEWGFDKIFQRQSSHEVPLNAVAATLAINRCIDPCSKVKISSWYKETTLPFLLGVNQELMNSSRIFRELCAIEEKKDELCNYLQTELTKRDPNSMGSLYYDLSTTTFSGTKCLFVKWGHCKEGYDNHVVLALVVNKKGFPIYWNVLPGGTSDASSIEWMFKDLREKFSSKGVTAVFDRGMVSDDNLNLLEESGIKYISAMDKNQIKDHCDMDFKQFCSLSSEEIVNKIFESNKFVKVDKKTYSYDVPCQGKRRYVLCFNPELRQEQQDARAVAICDFDLFLRQTNKELLGAEKSRSEESTQKKLKNMLSQLKIKSFVDIVIKKKVLRRETVKGVKRITTFQADYVIDEKNKQQAGLLDGFWMCVTNHTEKECAMPDIVRPYREKLTIEFSFRDIKSFTEISPVRVWTVDHVKAHYTICVLAHFMNRALSEKLKENAGEESSQIVSHEEFLDRLNSCRLNKLKLGNSKTKHVLTQPTDIQKDLLKRVGFSPLLRKNFDGLDREPLALITSTKK
jgi:transposase